MTIEKYLTSEIKEFPNRKLDGPIGLRKNPNRYSHPAVVEINVIAWPVELYGIKSFKWVAMEYYCVGMSLRKTD